MAWRIDIKSRTATNENGIVVRFFPSPDTPGTWDGTADQPLPAGIPADAATLARLMREAGDDFITALGKEKK